MNGSAPPPLAGDAPKSVVFGVILVQYRGAQGAPASAPWLNGIGWGIGIGDVRVDFGYAPSAAGSHTATYFNFLEAY